MTSSPATTEKIDLPECPICLEPYDGDYTIPRILACGHSTCETCLTELHRSSSLSPARTIRCPACTHLVNFPHPPGPTALPKNIDLIHFSLLLQSLNPNSNLKPANSHTHEHESPPRRRFRFPPENSSHELYAAWKDWVLPNEAVLRDGDDGDGRVRISSSFFDLGLSSIMRCRLVENQKVGLVKVGRFELVDQFMEYSYVGKVMSVLGCLSDAQRTELGFILGASLRSYCVCRVLGLWLDVESGILYLVSERMNDGLLNLENLVCGIGQKSEDLVSYLATIGVELCEALMGLRLEGFVCGCLSLSCFGFDEFGHLCIDMREALVTGRKIRECLAEALLDGQKMDDPETDALVVNVINMDVFVSPEVLFELLCMEGVEMEKNDISCAVCYGSDVWFLACVFLRLLIGKEFTEEMCNYLKAVFGVKHEGVSGCKLMYLHWVETIKTMLGTLLGSNYASLQEILLKCLDIDSQSRPLVTDVWRSIKGLNIYHHIRDSISLNRAPMKENVGQCLVLGELCNMSNDLRNKSRISALNKGPDDCETDFSQAGELSVDVVKRMSVGKVHCKDLQGHLDCITALCVGGGFLFSSSFDKTINVWSLQDLTHVHTFRGHKHRVMAVVFVDQEKPLCISADSEGGIFSWEVIEPFGQEPVKKWYEEKNWRYSGIHALATSGNGYLYTGSGDRLIKAWSLRDYTLVCCMEGHKSVVSTLALCNGVLYSGSWDGTVRLWCLHDHSPLAVFGQDVPGTVSSVLSLRVSQNMIIAAHENGHIKIWMNDVFKASEQIHNGAVFTLAMEENWLFSGGWDRSVKIQEIMGAGSEMDIREVGSIACDSVVTALMYAQGILFVGHANRLIKAYHCGT